MANVDVSGVASNCASNFSVHCPIIVFTDDEIAFFSFPLSLFYLFFFVSNQLTHLFTDCLAAAAAAVAAVLCGFLTMYPVGCLLFECVCCQLMIYDDRFPVVSDAH